MKSAHLRNFNNPSRIGQLYLSGFWRILVQSEMASAIVIIGEIGSKSFSKRFFVDNDDVIEAFPSNRSNQALNIGALPGGSGCRKHLIDPHVLQLPLNLDAIDTVSIPDYVLRGAVIRKSLNKLLRSPFCGWMRCHIEVKDAATLMRENEEDIEDAEGDCRDGEKIDRSKLLGVVFQKYAPSLGGRFVMSNHVFGNGCLRDINSELEQFPMNSRGSPEGIIFAKGADELTNIFRNPQSSRLAMPTFPGPKQSESLVMPTNDCIRFNNNESRAPLGPKAKEPNPEESVPKSEFGPVGGTFQDDDLLSQSEDLGLEREARSKAGEKG